MKKKVNKHIKKYNNELRELLSNSYEKEKIDFWNFVFGLSGLFFIILSAFQESLFKLMVGILFLGLAALQNE